MGVGLFVLAIVATCGLVVGSILRRVEATPTRLRLRLLVRGLVGWIVGLTISVMGGVWLLTDRRVLEVGGAFFLLIGASAMTFAIRRMRLALPNRRRPQT